MTQVDVERPNETSQTDVTLVTRGITFQAAVELSSSSTLVLRPTLETYARNVGVKLGDRVELYWPGEYEERMLPAEISGVDDDEGLRWHVAITGAAERSTRRKAVRASLEIPVQVRVLDSLLIGQTVDLSEAGMRAAVDGWGLPPESGTSAEVDVETDPDDVVSVRATVVRLEDRAGRWTISLRFDDVSEHDGDRLRRRVFQALREERTQSGH